MTDQNIRELSDAQYERAKAEMLREDRSLNSQRPLSAEEQRASSLASALTAAGAVNPRVAELIQLEGVPDEGIAAAVDAYKAENPVFFVTLESLSKMSSAEYEQAKSNMLKRGTTL